MKECYHKNEYVVLLGKLKSNLISLETILRFYILKKEGDDQNFVDPSKANVGDLVEKNAFTNYDMLSSLIKKYNKYHNNTEAIDENDIVSIRDLLAHGRAYSLKEDIFPLTIIKFKPENSNNLGKVEVSHKEILDKRWFNDSINKLCKIMLRIEKELMDDI
jgi:hypothetical protein